MSTDLIIQARKLNYSFRKGVPTLRDIELAVPRGSIYGFLGPNGAGKTTTLRLILGLLRVQEGNLSVFGQQFHQHRREILRRLGSLIEQPSLYGHLTASENLEIYRQIHAVPKSRVAEVLKLVGLETTGRKKARQFSLGMKQRLSIAIALLHQPELLILDEPTNGLDPNGIIETRELIKKLNREFGTTVLVSSHILTEVERMATHVGIIHKGKMLFQGTLGELQQMKVGKQVLEVETDDNLKAVQLLLTESASANSNGKIVMPYRDKEHAARINQQLVQAGLKVYALQTGQNDLEQLFIDITSQSE
ncbi:MAG: ABC transporter ATP-binding protein [Chitinophagaceae bacterium]|nr:ABC transporter ATP-binding protein [Chitinophagaceae bacterium]